MPPSSETSNPWAKLPASEFVLPEDRPLIDDFNRKTRAIDDTLIPEPFLGLPNAPVVLLNLNPGLSQEDTKWHKNPQFIAQSRANLFHAATPYPFFLLNPDLDAPGCRWWSRKLRWLVDRVERRTVASRLLCVEYFPYHTRIGGRFPLLPSQGYGFNLVRAAIHRSAIIVVLRSEKRWIEAVPELRRYRRRYNLQSPQNVSVSPRNCPEGFNEIVRSLSA